MAISDHGDHQLKRIVLPSGKTIEVVYFDHPAELEQPTATRRPETPPATRKHRELHLCQDCDSTLVYPVHWEEAGENHWDITLRCPNCEWSAAGSFNQGLCDRFDDELERGTEALTRDYKRLVTANLADEIDRFAHALETGGIFPMDF